MFPRMTAHKSIVGLLALLMLILAACAPATPAAPAVPTPLPSEPLPSEPLPTAEPTQPAAPVGGLSGLDAEDILIQLTYEPGFTLPEYRFPFGRTPFFTLLADGRVIYMDESKDFQVMLAQLSRQEAEALLKQVREMGFDLLESHTDMCGKMADGTESCVADASTSVMRVRMEDGSLREIRNYANFSNGPVTYEAIYNLLNEYTHPQAAVYTPRAATLFVRIVPPPDQPSPADWPLDPTYVKQAQEAPDQFTAVILDEEEAALWQKNVGVSNNSIVFQLEGQHAAGFFVPWLPGDDFSKEIAAEFPVK